MNLILFRPGELDKPLPEEDPRSRHILHVLKVREGETFDAGLIQGPRGKALLNATGPKGLSLQFTWLEEPAPLFPIDLWVSFCRPQTCRRILRECTSLGVRSMSFFDTEKGEPAYRRSKLWSSDEWERILIQGAEQAFCTRLPELELGTTLAEKLTNQKCAGTGIALDNYEANHSLDGTHSRFSEITVAIGGERGWSNRERQLLRQAGFTLMDLGPRVLRTDTACIAALSVLRNLLSV